MTQAIKRHSLQLLQLSKQAVVECKGLNFVFNKGMLT